MAEADKITNDAKRVGEDALDVVIDYGIPLVTGIVAFSGAINAFPGGFNAIWGSLQKVPQLTINGSTQAINRVAGAILGVLYAGIGSVFWKLGKSPDYIMRAVGKGVGAYFYGGAANMVAFQIIAAQSVAINGPIDLAAQYLEEAAGA